MTSLRARTRAGGSRVCVPYVYSSISRPGPPAPCTEHAMHERYTSTHRSTARRQAKARRGRVRACASRTITDDILISLSILVCLRLPQQAHQ
jgi:hypothetical protein